MKLKDILENKDPTKNIILLTHFLWPEIYQIVKDVRYTPRGTVDKIEFIHNGVVSVYDESKLKMLEDGWREYTPGVEVKGPHVLPYQQGITTVTYLEDRGKDEKGVPLVDVTSNISTNFKDAQNVNRVAFCQAREILELILENSSGPLRLHQWVYIEFQKLAKEFNVKIVDNIVKSAAKTATDKMKGSQNAQNKPHKKSK